jgi:hypothetical protein
MFLLFMPIRPFENKVAEVGVSYVPVAGSAIKYTKKAMKVTTYSNPVTAITRATGYIVIICTGPVIKYPALCALWGGTTIIGWSTGNPALISASFEFADMILEEGGYV